MEDEKAARRAENRSRKVQRAEIATVNAAAYEAEKTALLKRTELLRSERLAERPAGRRSRLRPSGENRLR